MKSIFTAIGIFVALMGGAWGQDDRCAIIPSECIDLSGGGGTHTETVPSNVTRFETDGISICLSQQDTANLPVDVVFVVDQSGSMAGTDSLRYAPTAIKNGLALLDSMASGSYATVLRFATGVSEPSCLTGNGKNTSSHPMTPLDTGLNILQTWVDDNVASTSVYQELGCSLAGEDNEYATNYILSLSTADAILQEGIRAKKAIIFITDGEPCGPEQINNQCVGTPFMENYDDWSGKADLPPVYSIFIGGPSAAEDCSDSTSSGGRLGCLASLTGGSYNPIPANDNAALAAAMQDVVEQVLFPGVPDSTFITNTATSQSASARGTGNGTGHVEQQPTGSGNWQVNFDSVMAIDTGFNEYRIVSYSTKNGIEQDSVVFTLNIEATGPARDAGDPYVPDELFDITCVDPSLLEVTEAGNFSNVLPELPYDATRFGIQLTSPSGDTLPDISLNNSDNSDQESTVLTAISSSVYQSVFDFLATNGTPSTNNEMEEELGGFVYLKWEHPRDSRDSAVTSVNVQQPQVEPPEANGDTPFQSSTTVTLFSASDDDSIYPGDTVTIYYTLDGSDPATSTGNGTFLYTGPITLVESTQIRAIAVRNGWQNSTLLDTTFTKDSEPSEIQILDENGQPFAGDIIYSDATQYSIHLATNQAGVDPYEPTIVSTVLNDTVALSMPLADDTDPGGGFVFNIETVFDFNGLAGSANTGNSILESNQTDTLIVTWTNPFDNSDVATHTIYVQPAPFLSSVHFSTSNSLNDEVTAYDEGATPVWVIVRDQTVTVGLTYEVVLTTNSSETETITLTPVTDSTLAGQIPASYNPITPNDGSLDILLVGVNITAEYTDPLYTTGPNQDISRNDVPYAPRTVATPTADVPDGTFFDVDTTITLTTATPGATIRYTTDDTDPSVDPDAGIDCASPCAVNIATSTVITAIAYFQNADTNVVSGILVRTYNLKGQVGFPRIIPPTTYFSNDTIARIIPAADSDTVVYTTDGSDPTTSSTRILDDADAVVLNINATTTVRFQGVNAPGIASGVRTATYTKRDTLPPPVADPPDGTIFYDDTTVFLSHSTVPTAVIRYTTDGSDPNATSPQFVISNPLTFTQPTTIRARAYTPSGAHPPGPTDPYEPSSIATFTYTPKVKPPTATPGDTSFTTILLVSLSTETPDAQIWYTDLDSEPDYTEFTQNIRLTNTDTIRAYASRNGWANSDTVTFVYTRNFMSSVLEILDVNLQPIEYLTELNSSFSIRLLTSEIDLSSADIQVITYRNGDSEVATLANSSIVGGNKRFNGLADFNINPGAAVAGDNRVTSGWFDSVIVKWTNPNIPADSASDTIRVRPAPQQADIFFSSTLGNDPVTAYQTDVDTVYVMVADQVGDTNYTYDVMIVTEPRFGVDREPDTLVTEIVEISPGLYGVALPVDKNETSDPSDDLLQALNADELTATYLDPVDGDADTASILYGQPGEVRGTLEFVRTNERDAEAVPDGEYWSPGADSVYLRYIDDYITAPKSLSISVVNRTGTGRLLFDNLTLNLSDPIQEDSVGIWMIAIPMDESASMNTGNDALEIYFRGEIIASLVSHNRNGFSLNLVQDLLLVANPDDTADITITDNQKDDGSVDRHTTEVLIEINDQDFTNDLDTILADVQCVGTGDFMRDVRLVQRDDGTYVVVIDKDENPSVVNGDSVLTCLANDEIVVTYTDPVYDTRVTNSTEWTEIFQTRVYIVDGDNEIIGEVDSNGVNRATLQELNTDHFFIRVEALSEDRNNPDTLQVRLLSSDGDVLTVDVFETGDFTRQFLSDTVRFAFTDQPSTDNDSLEGTLDRTSSENQLSITAIVQGTAISDTAYGTVTAAYVNPEKAWIIDGNGDGSADTIFVQFGANLPGLPDSVLSINWPSEESEGLVAYRDIDVIDFLRDEDDDVIDSSLIIIVLDGALDGEVFDRGATAIDEDNPPNLTQPPGIVFQGTTVALEDSVGPVIVRAQRVPSDGETFLDGKDSLGNDIYRINPDTVLITISEPIIPSSDCADWDSLVQFSYSSEPGQCDADTLHYLRTYKCQIPELVSDSGGLQTYRFIVTNELTAFKPRGEFCARLNPGTVMTDTSGVGPSGDPVPGENQNINNPITRSRIYIPVIGGFQTRQGQSIFGQSNDTLWIPPVGYDTHTGEQDLDAYDDCNATPDEPAAYREYPVNCLSAVQVFSDGGYTADITIFDHYGKFLHSSTQKFGSCGELLDEGRITEEGFQSFLVWNTKDQAGDYVGSGVYIWKVKFTPNGNLSPVEAVYKQGIARSEAPGGDCNWED